ncbi:hypothetical protein SUGI_0091550 [Cryptomeria japonica]|nr:hypothetical protein SUGI_0091550 [Cryptomeria japonica]
MGIEKRYDAEEPIRGWRIRADEVLEATRPAGSVAFVQKTTEGCEERVLHISVPAIGDQHSGFYGAIESPSPAQDALLRVHAKIIKDMETRKDANDIIDTPLIVPNNQDWRLGAASIFEFVFVFAQLECEKSRIVINMEGQRTTPRVVSYTRNEARLVEEKRSEEDKPTWLSFLQSIGRLLEDKIGQSTAEVIPTVGGAALSPTTVKDGEENNFRVNSKLQFALVDQSISSSYVKSRHFSTPDRARHDFVEQRGQRLPLSSQRSHSVSPQRTQLAASRWSSFDAQQERGQNLPQRHQAYPLQQGCNSSQSGQKELPESTFPSELTNGDYINILQSLGQTIHILKPTGEITYWNRFVELLYGYSTSEPVGQNAIELLVHQNNFDVANSIIDRITVEESWKGQFPLETNFGKSFSAVTSNMPFYDEVNLTHFGDKMLVARGGRGGISFDEICQNNRRLLRAVNIVDIWDGIDHAHLYQHVEIMMDVKSIDNNGISGKPFSPSAICHVYVNDYAHCQDNYAYIQHSLVTHLVCHCL